MLYQKEFEMTPRGGVLLKNPQQVAAYVDEKIAQLLKTKDDHIAQREVKCKIFSDFKGIYEYDVENAIYPEPFGTFASEEAKQAFIKLKLLYEDFQLYLGEIFVNYHHELTKSNPIPMIDASTLVIDYNELFDTALAEYIRVLHGIPHPVQLRAKDIREPEFSTVEYRGEELRIPTGRVSRQVHACAATFILPSFIEHFLLVYLEGSVKMQWLLGMRGKALDPDEAELYNKCLAMTRNGHGVMTEDKNTVLERVWNMGVKYGAFQEDQSMKEMLCGRNKSFNTLGVILQSDYARSRIRPEYLQILDYMFGKKMLNLRNSIAHGLSTTYDYLSLAFVGVMVQIVWDIGSNDVIMGYEY